MRFGLQVPSLSWAHRQFSSQVQSADTDPVHFSLMDTPGLNLNAPSVLEINSTGAVIKKRFFDYQDAPNKLKVVVVAKTSDAFTTSCIYYIKVCNTPCIVTISVKLKYQLM